MKGIPFIILCFGLTSSISVIVNETTPSETREVQPPNSTSYRRGRQIEEVVELLPPSRKIKRQIIKIPPNVSKVKLVQPPLNLRYNRAPQQFSRFPPIFRSGDPWRMANKKSQTEPDFEADSFHYELKKSRKNLKKPSVREVTPGEFFRDEEYDFEQDERKHPRQQRVQKQRNQRVMKKGKTHKNALGEYLENFEGQQEDLFHGPNPAGSTIHMQQIPAPNLLQDNFPTGLNVKKLPTKGRQVQSLFSQQYTTHNPHVTTNFGLSAAAQMNGLHYGTFVDASPYDFPGLGKYSQPVAASSDEVLTALPVNTLGIQVIQPPQFRDVTVSRPSHPSRLMGTSSQQNDETTSQKATIKDILERDCPGFDAKGYCDSPPRYPMQQIKNIIKQCASLMEVMNTQPFEEHHEVYGFAKRADHDQEKENKTVSTSAETEMEAGDQTSSWSRSSTDGLTACISDLELSEPGYAKEVNSGRWFVIVQHPGTTIQRIATDMCRSPGKSCGRLSEMKCTKIPIKSTRCIQRYTYQRLISWDPESPEECPRMRVFRFPSACVCHLGVF